MLIEKDFLFNWVTPIIGATGRVENIMILGLMVKVTKTYFQFLFIQKEAIL